MDRTLVSLALIWLLATSGVHNVAAQSSLTCFFTTDFATYSAEEQVIDVVFTIEAPSDVGQAPLSLTTVLDRSGSMLGNKIELLKKTTQFLVGKLSEAGGNQNLGIVTYSDGVQELNEVTPVSASNAPVLNNLIATIQAGGQTNLAGGVVKGVEQQKAAPGGKIKSVYLFTDGLPTVGPASSGEILAQVNAARSGGDQITISTFGFGSDLDVGLLKSISDSAGGQTYIITNEEDIPKAFGDALGGALSTAAQDISVVFKPEGGASIESVETGGSKSEEDGGVRVTFSNLFAEEKRDILLKIKIPAGSGKQTVASAQVSYTDGSTLQRVNKDPQSVSLDRSGAAPADENPDETVQKTKLRFDTAKALAEAKSKAEAGDSAGAATAVATAIATVEVSPVKDDPTIQALLADVRKIKELLETQGAASASKVEELETTLSEQRSTTAGSDLESAKAVDTSKRRETREEAKQEVLSAPPVTVDPTLPTDPVAGTGPAVEPAPSPTPEPTAETTIAPAVEPAPGPTTETSPGPAVEPTPGPVAETPPGPAVEPSPGPAVEPTPGPVAETPAGPAVEPSPGPAAETTAPAPQVETTAPAPTTESPAEPTAPAPQAETVPAPTSETAQVTAPVTESPAPAPTTEPAPSPTTETPAEPAPSPSPTSETGDAASAGEG